jgi:hypothetical protein
LLEVKRAARIARDNRCRAERIVARRRTVLWTFGPPAGIVFSMKQCSIWLFLLCLGCDGASAIDAGTDAGPDPLRADCEPLVPEFCALPWPSDYYLVDDPSTPSGKRLALGPTTLPRTLVRRREHVDPAPLATRDGWSVNGSILAYLPGATATGLASSVEIARSLEASSPTILIDASSGERVPHFAVIDEAVADEAAPRALIIRPAVVLEHETRYIVAIRSVVDSSGAAIDPSPVFAALRDGSEHDLAYVRDRRAHFEQIFTTLETAGVERASLQLAWDFTTASLENDTGWMLAVRDAALAIVGDQGPPFRVETVEEFTPEENESIARRIHGFMEVPLFLTGPEAGSRLTLGADGMPEQNGTAEFPFVVNVPRSATPDTPAKPIQYGHGLLGDRSQANAGWLSAFGNANGYMPFGVDWTGMMIADVAPITIAISSGELEDFVTVPERLIQGVVNALLAMRMMLGGFANAPEMMVDGRSILDTSEGFYTGDSQGGIFGGTYMALSTDVTRGTLGVPGQPYNLLLNRSVDFDPYLSILRTSFEDGVEIQLAMAYMQQIWDRAEPGSYTRHITNDLFPGTPSHRVILQAAIGDHQVTTLGAHIMARAIGATTVAPQTRAIFGIEEATALPLTTGNALVEYDFGLVEPIGNVPVREGDDPHGAVRRQAATLAQTLRFFTTGEITHTCDGVCDPE